MKMQKLTRCYNKDVAGVDGVAISFALQFDLIGIKQHAQSIYETF